MVWDYANLVQISLEQVSGNKETQTHKETFEKHFLHNACTYKDIEDTPISEVFRLFSKVLDANTGLKLKNIFCFGEPHNLSTRLCLTL